MLSHIFGVPLCFVLFTSKVPNNLLSRTSKRASIFCPFYFYAKLTTNSSCLRLAFDDLPIAQLASSWTQVSRGSIVTTLEFY